MQNFLIENQLETIGIIAILTLCSIYLILNLKKKEQPKEEVKERKNSLHVEIKEEEIVTKAVVSRKKRELIEHEKITKDDFSIFSGVKILVAEDNIINQKVVMGLLSTSGIEITVANDGQEVLEILQNNTDFSLIFMDAHMPTLDGFQATRVIRKNPKYEHIPIVALSGDAAVDDIKNMLNVGMEAHIEKPLKMDALYDILYIFTTGDESKNSSLIMKNSGLKEFDTAAGLEICGGDREFYLEILQDFTLKYANSARVIQELISNSDGLGASKMLLDVSGIAANIGAEELQQIAIELKESILNPTDLDYIDQLRKYKRLLQQICEAINEYTSQN